MMIFDGGGWNMVSGVGSILVCDVLAVFVAMIARSGNGGVKSRLMGMVPWGFVFAMAQYRVVWEIEGLWVAIRYVFIAHAVVFWLRMIGHVVNGDEGREWWELFVENFFFIEVSIEERAGFIRGRTKMWEMAGRGIWHLVWSMVLLRTMVDVDAVYRGEHFGTAASAEIDASGSLCPETFLARQLAKDHLAKLDRGYSCATMGCIESLSNSPSNFLTLPNDAINLLLNISNAAPLAAYERVHSVEQHSVLYEYAFWVPLHLFALFHLMAVAEDLLAAVLLGFGLSVAEGFPLTPIVLLGYGNKLWSTGWHSHVSHVLRRAVYQPLRRQFGLKPPAAILAVFIVSGLWHEINIAGTPGANPGTQLLFFLIVGSTLALSSESTLFSPLIPVVSFFAVPLFLDVFERSFFAHDSASFVWMHIESSFPGHCTMFRFMSFYRYLVHFPFFETLKNYNF